MTIFYVYALIDPKTNQLFYIGKGKGDRLNRQLRLRENDSNRRKYHRIRRILEAGLSPIGIKLFDNLSEEEAFQHERRLIAEHGRIGIDPNGILTNLTEGGDGVAGHKHSDETKNHLRLLKQGKNNPNFGKARSEETCKRISDSNIGKSKNQIWSKESRNKISQVSKERWKTYDEDRRNEILNATLRAPKSFETINKIRNKLKGRKMTAEQVNKMIQNRPPMNEDIKSKIRATKKGKPWTEARRTAQEKRKAS